MTPYELHLPQKGHPPWPVILILPILGRIFFLPDFWIERWIARFFNRHGFATGIVRRGFFIYEPSQGISQVGAYLSDSVKKAKETLDEILKNPQINSEQVGSLGISFGGVLNVLLTARDRRIKASIFALAGGNLPEIMTTSRDPLLKNYCDILVKGLGMHRKEFEAALKTHLEEEPLDIAPEINSEKVLMIIARFDRVVFPRYAKALWDALGRPQTIFLPLGHYFSLLTLPYLERKALNFFKQKLLA